MLHYSLPRLGLIALASISLSLASVTPAMAVTYQLVTTVDGAQAGTASPGAGSGTLTFDDVSNLLNWNITFGGLVGTQTNAHFHGPAAPGFNGGIQIGLPLGSPLIGSAILTATQETQLLGEQWYLNIHSSTNGAGEIRGQLLLAPVPEPEAYAMMIAGLGLIGLAVRRKRLTSKVS